MFCWKHIRMHFGWIVLMTMVNNGVQAWTYHYNTDTSMEWEIARQWCRQHYTDMVAIQNKQEVIYLNQMLPLHRSYYWIGLRKMAGQWTWVGTMKPLAPEAASWATGEPNNQGTSEDCVEIYIKRSKDPGMWNDDNCSKKKAALCYTASCFERSCSEHAECVENIGNYTCECNPGFTGPRCNEAVECGAVKTPEQGFVQCSHVYGDFRFNSSCQFHCARGYILQGSKHLHCLSLGKWDHDPPECQVVECPPITTSNSGWNMTCNHPRHTNSYNSTCVFRCDEGFELRGSHTTRCDHTGQWTHNTPTCTAVTCEPLVMPEKGHMTCTDPLGKFSFRSSCAVTCEEGYMLRGENTLTCIKTGNWSAETPTCEVVRCSALNSAPHGSTHCTDPLEKFAYSSICRFECDIGFLLMGSNYTYCNAQGNWTHCLPVCQVVQCSPLSAHSSDVRMNCTHPLSTNSYNSTCVFNCDEGFKLIGSYKTQCDHTGQWTAKSPTCKAVTCEPLVRPEKGHMTCTEPLGKFSFRSSCAVTCEEGYTLRGESTLTCIKTGNWSAETPTCEAVTCEPLVRPEKGHMTCTDPLGKFSFRSSCAVTCEEGYTLRGENTLTCVKTGNWSAETPTCEVVRCSALNSAPHGSMHCTDPLEKFAYSSICRFECDIGFLLMGSNYTYCNAQGNWTHSLPVCQVVQCSPLSAHSSDVRMNCTHPLSTNSYNSTCVFNCDEGFKLIGSYKTQCDHTGQWTAKSPTCKAVTCEPLVMPEKGHMTCTDPLGKFSFRSSCAVTCEEGYTLRGENTLTCIKTGNWSAETPTCEVVRCSALNSAPHGSMHCTDPLEKFAYSSICRFECDIGFLLMGSNYTYCNVQGNWTHSLPVCQARQCPLLASPEKGWMNCSHPHFLFSYGSHCGFGCDIGYVLREESKLDCTTAGTWSQEIPSCKVVQCESLLRAPLLQSDSVSVPFMNCSHPRGDFSFGSRCAFSCPEGYRLNGTTDLMCTSGGFWTGLLPTCITEDMPLGPAFLIYGAIGAASSLGLLLMGGLVMLLVRKFSKDTFTPDYSAWDGALNPVFEEN
ncbi:P-selectin isoform X1 [Ictalurus punctatus]|uniref:E-selectin n=1 Tax=Ictalurus punctatus TaxID=7998 RepID=A0A2D0Q379_ICTPU|nr:P-selectin isoform X1 [Ictalurus punctatus]